MNALQWYRSLAEREQQAVLYGGIAAAALLLAGGLWGLESATSSIESRVTAKRADLAWMQAVAPRLQSMPAARPDESLALTVARTAKDTGLAGALSAVDPAGDGGVRVRFEEASFDSMVIWLGRVQQERGLVVESASIDRTPTEGQVNVSLVLRSP
jgi:type II secretory pathway component PulM